MSLKTPKSRLCLKEKAPRPTKRRTVWAENIAAQGSHRDAAPRTDVGGGHVHQLVHPQPAVLHFEEQLWGQQAHELAEWVLRAGCERQGGQRRFGSANRLSIRNMWQGRLCDIHVPAQGWHWLENGAKEIREWGQLLRGRVLLRGSNYMSRRVHLVRPQLQLETLAKLERGFGHA